MQKLERRLAAGADPLGWDALADLCEERGDSAGAGLWRRRAACLRAAEFRRVWETLEAFGAVDGWGGVDCRRVWREYLDAGMPEDIAEFIRRRANLMADGSERGMV